MRFDNYEIDGKYSLTPALSFGLGYTYSRLSGDAAAHWNQLSKRTDVYALAVYEKASGSNDGVPVQAERFELELLRQLGKRREQPAGTADRHAHAVLTARHGGRRRRIRRTPRTCYNHTGDVPGRVA